ncbi:triose-phosphate isomerase [Patescibacteria group bacterium]|nr:triose-phosphate isomerase [Patescibacteria group bacterium]
MENNFLIVANWKAFTPETKKWFQEFSIRNLQFENKIEIAIAPSFPLISSVSQEIQISNLKFQIASQDVSRFPEGPYTGEVPAAILAKIGVKYCLVGHSERRKNFGEMADIVAEKVKQLLANGITPIVCARNLSDIPDVPNLPYVMYEPEEAISTNGIYHPESPENINKVLSEWQTILPGTKFLYGGSVNPDFKFQISNFKLISGLVVGHASLDSASFSAIINSLQS